MRIQQNLALPSTQTSTKQTAQIEYTSQKLRLSKELFQNAAKGTRKKIRELLDCGADPTFTGPQTQTPLHLAAEADNEPAINELLSRNPSAIINMQDMYGETPLHTATRNKKAGAAKCLLAHGADVMLQDVTECYPFHNAVTMTSTETGCKILEAAKDKKELLIKHRDAEKKTPLHFAVEDKKNEWVKELIRLDAELEAQDKDGNTPLLTAIDEEFFDIAKDLILHKANINALNNDKRNALHIAVLTHNIEAVKFLARSDIDLEQVDNNGDNPLHLACKTNKYLLLIELLKHKHASKIIHHKNAHDQSALMISIIYGHLDCVRVILYAMGEVDAQNADLQASLQLAQKKLEDYKKYELMPNTVLQCIHYINQKLNQKSSLEFDFDDKKPSERKKKSKALKKREKYSNNNVTAEQDAGKTNNATLPTEHKKKTQEPSAIQQKVATKESRSLQQKKDTKKSQPTHKKESEKEPQPAKKIEKEICKISDDHARAAPVIETPHEAVVETPIVVPTKTISETGPAPVLNPTTLATKLLDIFTSPIIESDEIFNERLQNLRHSKEYLLAVVSLLQTKDQGTPKLHQVIKSIFHIFTTIDTSTWMIKRLFQLLKILPLSEYQTLLKDVSWDNINLMHLILMVCYSQQNLIAVKMVFTELKSNITQQEYVELLCQITNKGKHIFVLASKWQTEECFDYIAQQLGDLIKEYENNTGKSSDLLAKIQQLFNASGKNKLENDQVYQKLISTLEKCGAIITIENHRQLLIEAAKKHDIKAFVSLIYFNAPQPNNFENTIITLVHDYLYQNNFYWLSILLLALDEPSENVFTKPKVLELMARSQNPHILYLHELYDSKWNFFSTSNKSYDDIKAHIDALLKFNIFSQQNGHSENVASKDSKQPATSNATPTTNGNNSAEQDRAPSQTILTN